MVKFPLPKRRQRVPSVSVPRGHMRDYGRDRRRTFPTVAQNGSAHDPVAGLRPFADPVAETLSRHGVGTAYDAQGLYDLKRLQ